MIKQIIYSPVPEIWYYYLDQINIENDIFPDLFEDLLPGVEYHFYTQDSLKNDITLYRYPRDYETQEYFTISV